MKRNKLRTIATGFAVTSGLFLLIVLLGAGNGLIHSFTANMGNMSFDAIHVYGGRTTKPYEGIKEGRRIELDQRDREMTERTFSDRVKDVMPTCEQSGMVAAFEGKYLSATLTGVYPGYAASYAIKMLEGRFINDIDVSESRKALVISDKNVKDLFKDGKSALGQVVSVGNIPFRVVGIYKANEMNQNSELYAPYSTISTIYNKGEKLDELTMTIKNIPTEEAMEEFEKDFLRSTSRIHSFSPDDRSALWIWNQAKDSISMNKAMDILHIAFWVLGLLTLLSGIVGVSNIMLISVKERTREFGIRRAIGAHPWAIIRMVILESIIITGIFGYIGMVLGVLFCEWMDKTVGNQTMDVGVFQAKYFVDPTVDLSICIYATIVIIVAGALAGFFPARKAMKVKPIEAMRG